MKYWVAFSVTVASQFGDALSNFLIEQGATGIEERDEEPERQTLKAYFPGDERESILLRLRRYLRSLQAISPGAVQPKVEIASVPEKDWGRNWRRYFKPVEASRRFIVKPPWSRTRLKKDQIAIDIHPGMAFGTGTHASTKLCLRAIGSIFGNRGAKKGLSVLDLGTGSGVLSIAAARMGAREVCGLDIDDVALANARENVVRNGVSDVVRLKRGRIGEVRKEFDVIVANIDYRNLRRLRWPLLGHLKEGGSLVLSGVLWKEKEGFRRYYTDTGHFSSVRELKEEEWVCLILKKKSRTP